MDFKTIDFPPSALTCHSRTFMFFNWFLFPSITSDKSFSSFMAEFSCHKVMRAKAVVWFYFLKYSGLVDVEYEMKGIFVVKLQVSLRHDLPLFPSLAC